MITRWYALDTHKAGKTRRCKIQKQLSQCILLRLGGTLLKPLQVKFRKRHNNQNVQKPHNQITYTETYALCNAALADYTAQWSA